MPCGKWKVNFTRYGKRTQTRLTFNKKTRANAYARSLNDNLMGAKARVVKLKKRKK